jgi:hypothetical protein
MFVERGLSLTSFDVAALVDRFRIRCQSISGIGCVVGPLAHNKFPAGTQKPLVLPDVFGGITDCEGGGGWVSRTPFLAGNSGL